MDSENPAHARRRLQERQLKAVHHDLGARGIPYLADRSDVVHVGMGVHDGDYLEPEGLYLVEDLFPPPGSTTKAFFVCSSPRMKQLVMNSVTTTVFSSIYVPRFSHAHTAMSTPTTIWTRTHHSTGPFRSTPSLPDGL